jgi:predicted dehydrogenase
MPTSPVRFGILGFGLHAVRRLMPGFALATGCRVAALSRRNREQAEESARAFGIPLAFDSAEQLCRSPDVDAVFVTTPNARHCEDVLLALECGKPVLVEKPMGMNAGECREMLDAAQRKNLLLGVAQVFRFEESTARLRDRLCEIGAPVFARAEFSYPGRNHPRAWLNDKALAGGGPIADVGVHAIDALRFMLQDEVIAVSALSRSDTESQEVEAAAVLALQFSRGTLAAVLVSTRADYRTPLELVGERGVLFANDALNVERPIEIELRREGRTLEKEEVSNRLAYARQVDAFAAAVRGEVAFPVPGEEGLRNQLVLDAAYRSAASGKVENVSANP